MCFVSKYELYSMWSLMNQTLEHVVDALMLRTNQNSQVKGHTGCITWQTLPRLLPRTCQKSCVVEKVGIDSNTQGICGWGYLDQYGYGRHLGRNRGLAT